MTQKVPKLRFPGFSGGWEDKRLDDIADVTSSKRIYLSDYVDAGIPFFRGKEISELKRTKKASDVLYIKESKFLEMKNKFGVPKKNDILITSVGTLGNIFKVDLAYDFYFKDGNLIWLRSPSVNSDFLEEALDFFRKELLKGVIGSSQKALTIDGIKKVTIPFPSMSEQQKIAKFLGSVNSWIENLQKQKESLESYKKGMMQKIFSQEIRFKDEGGKDFEKWNKNKLVDLCQKIKSGGTPTSTKRKYYDGSIPFLSISDMTKNGKYIFKTEKFLTEEGLQNSSAWIVPADSIIYSMYASVGFVAINKMPLATSQAMIDLVPNKNIIDLEYFYYYLLFFKKFIHKFIETGTQGNLNAQIVKNLIIPTPCFSEQKKIAMFLSLIDEILESKQKQVVEAEKWKKGLMQRLFV